MPRIRDILVHVSVETAQGQRKCRRNKARIIEKGEQCLVVKTGPMNSPYSYSVEGAQQILNDAWKKLASLYSSLNLDPPWRRDSPERQGSEK